MHPELFVRLLLKPNATPDEVHAWGFARGLKRGTKESRREMKALRPPDDVSELTDP